ncbi:32922_t:CDS:2, partial [Gigaspora margarita]
KYSIVLQYTDGGDLNHYLKEFDNRLRLSEIIRMATKLAAGVHYFYNYKKEIMYSDLLSSCSPLKVNDKDVDKYLNTPRMQKNLGLVPVSGTPYNYISIYTKAWNPVPYNHPTIETIYQNLSGM